MELNREYYDWIDDRIEQLYLVSLRVPGVDLRQVREYIDVGEYGLAVDDLAEIQLTSGKPVAPDVIRLFDALAAKMDIRPGSCWDSVTRLLALHGKGQADS